MDPVTLARNKGAGSGRSCRMILRSDKRIANAVQPPSAFHRAELRKKLWDDFFYEWNSGRPSDGDEVADLLMVKCLFLSLPFRQFLPRLLRIRAFDLLENLKCRLCMIDRLWPLAELVERQAHVE